MQSLLALGSFSHEIKIAPKDFFGGFFAHLRDHFIPHHRNNYHPHVFSHSLTSLFALLLVAVKVFSLSYISLGPAIPAFSSAITSENIISLTNMNRFNFGLKALSANGILDQAAQKKAEDMAVKGYFSHTSPDGRLPWDFIQDSGYNYVMAGENLAVNFTEAENVEQAWMDSPSHKANILNKDFEEIGIGIAQGQYSGRNTVFVVQMFGVPAEQKIVLSSKATAVQTQTTPEPKMPSVAPETIKPAVNAAVAEATEPLAKSQESLGILDVNIQTQDNQVLASVKTSGPASKVLAVYGAKAVWMYPKSGDVWQANLFLQKLTQSSAKLSVKVFDIQGNIVEEQAAGFASTAAENFGGFKGQVAGKTLIFGRQLDLQNFQNRFYLFFAAAILTCLILAIAIKRHVQHISLVANGSFVTILAMLLWMG